VVLQSFCRFASDCASLQILKSETWSAPGEGTRAAKLDALPASYRMLVGGGSDLDRHIGGKIRTAPAVIPEIANTEGVAQRVDCPRREELSCRAHFERSPLLGVPDFAEHPARATSEVVGTTKTKNKQL
jgi:hypothetical protein